jgi:hypothetical protein
MNRPRAQRILGMTIPQLLILGCLILSIICTFVGGYWALNTIAASAYAIPNLPGLNATPLPSVTPLPTDTPLPTPSPTPITYESLIPAGWKQFKSASAPGMEIWLPPSYEVLSESLMQANKMNYVPVSDTESQEGLTSKLNLVDMTRSPYMLYTTFGMSTQPLPAADLDKTIDQEFSNMMLTARLMERDNFQIGNYPARKLVFDITGNGVTAGLVVFLIQDNGTVWYLGFTTPYNELYTRIPDFDRIAKTFRIVTP